MESFLRGIHSNVHLKGRYHWKSVLFSKREGKKFCCYHLRKSVAREQVPSSDDAGQGAEHPHCESPSNGNDPTWYHNVGANVEERGRTTTTKRFRENTWREKWLEDKRSGGYSTKGEKNAWHSIPSRCSFPPKGRPFTSFQSGPQPKHKHNQIVLTDQFINRANLKKEILDTHKKLTADSFIDKRKEEIYFLLRSAIMPNLKGKIYFIGSCENHIWIKNSDIDCCIVVENCEDKNSYLYILKVIKSAINLIYPSLTVNIIKASVPIAKIYREQNNICDISINNTVAIVNTKLVSSLCNTDERVTIINRVIKYWAKQKNINNRSQGTFSSYALFLLTYYFLQNLETPLLPPYKSIERENASSFEINSEYFFLQDDVEMPFYTDARDISSKLDTPRKNEDDVSKLLYGFFEASAKKKKKKKKNTHTYMYFYSRSSCRNGITLDIYNNQIIENKDMTANIFCPITKKIVNTYSINTWKKMFEKILAAHERLKSGKSLDVICEETKNTTPNRKIDLKGKLGGLLASSVKAKTISGPARAVVENEKMIRLVCACRYKKNSVFATSVRLLKRIKISSLKDGVIKKSIWKAQGKVTVDDALKHFTKSELFFLFVVPFTFASAYIVAMWTLFKYICDIRDIEHFIRTARWLNGKEPYPFEYLREGRKSRSFEGNKPIIVAVKKFE
ncbi:Uncharacterized protein PCOAH_00053500 [Plasmodium coatneyi]|uniref:Poly(A) RNA polymerase mitochondrial-like central palm domain-containing protein n=1 Tax=Plasmodium coatneyi TaxID=208452 RepID=A0A1B1E7D3_9APIC|nr:Uncharacterized protein PCOAH_00053500 [Plasmodium coatneyi]ANQ10942.1 Uncharacterized protein PCOAH_00053500 [Plasmodium coatneyi]